YVCHVTPLIACRLLRPRYTALRHFHPFPTRRSSDLVPLDDDDLRELLRCPRLAHDADVQLAPSALHVPGRLLDVLVPHGPADVRSEEHTSQLQSHLNLVCRLLLEKTHRTSASSRSSP